MSTAEAEIADHVEEWLAYLEALQDAVQRARASADAGRGVVYHVEHPVPPGPPPDDTRPLRERLADELLALLTRVESERDQVRGRLAELPPVHRATEHPADGRHLDLIG